MTTNEGPARADDVRPRGSGGRFDRFLVRLLGSFLAPLLDGSLAALRYRTAAGRPVVFPVQIARDGTRVVVRVGGAAHKHWWRHFRSAAPVEAWLGGAWWRGRAVAARGGSASAVTEVYRRAFQGVASDPDATYVVVELADRPPARSPLRGRGLFRAWFACVTVAEVLGFLVPAVAGALTADAAVAVALPALLVTGAVEGAALGAGQAIVLRAAVPDLPWRRWVGATAAASVSAYLLGMLPSLIGDRLAAWPMPTLIVLGVMGGLLLLASIGTAQWLVLRRHVRPAASWIGTTALAWTAGIGIFLAVCTPLWQPGQALALAVAIAALGGLLMAATVAAVTGAGLVRLLARATPAPDVPAAG